MNYLEDIKRCRAVRPFQLLIWILVITASCLLSCKKSDGDREPLSSDTAKPGPVSNVTVKNFNGGAVISYALPSTNNLLYVMAEYKINNTVVRQTKSSFFLDTIRVEGFQRSQDYTVTLHAVSRAEVKSDPVVVTVHPDIPYFQLIRNSLRITPDFGGINIKADNPARRSVGLNMIAIEPANNRLEIQNQTFLNSASIDYSIRGYEAVEKKFGVAVTDQFGNVSDTLFVDLTPLHEELLDKSRFSVYRQFTDATIGYGWEVPFLWDGLTTEAGGTKGWHTTVGPLPKAMQVTFAVGKLYKLSHFMLWARPSASYGYGNPRDFTVWGSSKDNPQDAVTPGGSAVGTVSGDWVVLGDYHFPNPPSGLLPGNTNAADAQFINNGVDFNVPFNSPSTKYIRFVIKDTWGGTDYAHMMELSFYGIAQ
ncbi:DUF4959 domain-containing protein [Pedobacter psychrodurus]|uniref:DUF4959 domain-containing protein n=1 Tax=Pedobacter psychrodurus TaxID=2530456 RepID=UPI002930B7E8|nr:DUF4959 domain-containing protein [Pedobacter psychrodurus]